MTDARFGTTTFRRLEGRDGQISYDFYVMGMSQTAIAEKYEITQGRVSQILSAMRADIDATTRDDVRAGILARTEHYRRVMADLVEREGAPVTAGKDGRVVTDPVTGEVVRDYGARVNAMRELRALDERMAKLFGTDEPTRTKTDLTVTGEAEQASELAAEARTDLDEGCG
jgi:hypothetical protein